MANFLERISALLQEEAQRQPKGPEIDPAIAPKLLSHLERVLKWGRSMNLTGAKDLKELVEEHLADALPLAFLLPSGGRLLDVGSGAGFPGMIVALVRPDIRVTLLESNHKKAVFLRTAAREAQLSNVAALDGDIFSPPPELAPPFSAVVSRAVFAPEKWIQIGAPFVAPGGFLYALLANDPPPVAPEGFSALQTCSYKLASGAKRMISVYQRSRAADGGL